MRKAVGVEEKVRWRRKLGRGGERGLGWRRKFGRGGGESSVGVEDKAR